MKEEDVKALAQAANELLALIDEEAIVIDVGNSAMKFGQIRQVLLNVEVSLFPFEEMLDLDEPQTVVPAPSPKPN